MTAAATTGPRRRLATNDGAELASNAVLGRVLWASISDEATRHLYQQIVERVRSGGNQAQFKLRCDSPSRRRHLQMTIRAVGTGIIEFETQSLGSDERPPLALLARATPCSTDLIRACSWCNRIDVGSDSWMDAEGAVRKLELFEARRMPQLTHGICAACAATMASSLGNPPNFKVHR